MPKLTREGLRRTIFIVLILTISIVLALVAVLMPLISQLLSPSLEVGQVAPQDYSAPAGITFVSEVLTQQKRESAARSVAPVYTSPDTSIARKQLEKLRAALAFISNVRQDEYATSKQKLDDLAALEDIHLSQETASSILALSDSRWQAVQQEAIVVLEQVMRNTIRPERIEDVRRGVPNLVSLALTEQQADLVAELASAFIAPNSLYSEELTEQARQAAMDAVDPVNRSFMTGQTIVQRGQVLDAADVEALQQLGLGQPEQRWQDPASAAGIVLLMAAFLALYLREKPRLPQNGRSLVVISGVFLVFLFGARLTIPGHAVIPFAFPIPAYGLIIAALFGPELALISSLPLAVLVAFGLPGSLELTLYYTMAGLFGVLALGKARRVASFFWAGLSVALAGIIVVLVYRLPEPGTDFIGIATLVGAAIFNGLASASLTILMQFFFAQFLDMTTPMQLMELTRPDSPLLQKLLRDAPGTYQHSLQVANLAEQAAERIGADPLLTRVGALYHDIGKTLNPIFFIENQVPGMLNPHDDLEPETSAETIIRHVPDGLELARKHRLPTRILDFISEHHGTMATRYQYTQAVNGAGGDDKKVDIEKFRYPGPRPQSRETAILMLADGCEARLRAEKPQEEERLRNLIKSTIDNRVAIGQLDDTTLTLQDIKEIQESFTATLRGIYHPRIKYPTLVTGEEEAKAALEETVPATSKKTSDVPVGTSIDTSSPASLGDST
jgi:putative nucleotidyltransferase with HDIG domain